MAQETISQRLKILIKELGLNPRSFSEKYGVNEGTTRGYTTRGSIPNADYIATLLRSIAHLNAQWLLLGEGDIFLNETEEPRAVYQKNSGGQNQNIGTNNGVAHMTSIEDCKRSLEAAQDTIKQLRSQLQDKERIIQLLEQQLKK